MIVILLKRVSLLADQLSKILLIFSIFSIKLELRDLSSITISLATHLILCKKKSERLKLVTQLHLDFDNNNNIITITIIMI